MGSRSALSAFLLGLPLLFTSLACVGAGAHSDPAPQQGMRRERILQNGWDRPHPNLGVYVVGRVGRAHLGGDFDGNTSLLGPDVIDLPSAGSGDSWSMGIGYRMPHSAMEFLYAEENYDGSIGGRSADVELWEGQINLLGFLPTSGELSPYGLIGIGFGEADLRNAGRIGSLRGDAELGSGGALLTGVGVQWQVSRNIALDMRAGYAFRDYDEARGVTGFHGDIDGGVDACSWNVTVGIVVGL